MTMNVLFEDINAIYAGKQVEKEKYTFYEYILDEKSGMPKGSDRKMKLILQI